MPDCGHQCCQIPSNSYHSHTNPPLSCPRCLALGSAMDAKEAAALARLVADVLGRVAPQIPGLPTGPELTAVVNRKAQAVYAAARCDAEVQALSERDRRRVLAVRVGLALAFPCDSAGRRRRAR